MQYSVSKLNAFFILISIGFSFFSFFFINKRKRGYSLTGKTPILHIDISGSSPGISKQKSLIFCKAREAQLGRAEL